MKRIPIFLGLISLVAWVFPWFGLVVAIAGIALSAKFLLEKDKRKIIILSAILSIIGLILVGYNFAYRAIVLDETVIISSEQRDLLADLDQYIINLKYYDSKLVDAIGNIEDLIKITPEDKTLELYKKRLTEAGVYLEERISELEGYRALYARGAISKEDLLYKIDAVDAWLSKLDVNLI